VTVDEQALREYWDADAATYVHTHAIASAATRAAWRAALARLLPPPPARVLDAGAGTGELSLLLAELGHRVTALDFSAGMLAELRDNAERRGLDVTVVTAQAQEPPEGPFDAVTARLLLWMADDPASVLASWRAVAPDGRLAVFEGIWGGTAPAQQYRAKAKKALARLRGAAPHHHDSGDPRIERLFSRSSDPEKICEAASAAGWPAVCLERLRDVEWAEASPLPPAERLLGSSPWYAVTAG
jgi:ubiquinone/menaquinone biosynthesis C-methylase UbiE